MPCESSGPSVTTDRDYKLHTERVIEELDGDHGKRARTAKKAIQEFAAYLDEIESQGVKLGGWVGKNKRWESCEQQVVMVVLEEHRTESVFLGNSRAQYYSKDMMIADFAQWAADCNPAPQACEFSTILHWGFRIIFNRHKH